MGKILWMLLLTLCLLKINHAQTLQTGSSSGELPSSGVSEAFNFFDQNDPDFIYLRDPQLQDPKEPQAQTPGPTKLTTAPKEINLLNIDSAKTSGPTLTPVPIISTRPATHQVILANPDQGKTQSGNLDGVGMPANFRDLQDKNPASSIGLKPSNTQGTGIKKESGNAHGQANVLKNLMDLEGESLVLFTLQNQQENTISKNPLDNREKNELLEAANKPWIMEGVLCKGPLGGLCGHGSLMGMNEIMKKIFPSGDSERVKIKDSQILQLSWKNTATSTNMVFQIKLTVKLSEFLKVLDDFVINVNIEVPTKVQNTESNKPLFYMMDCKSQIMEVKVESGRQLLPMTEGMIKFFLKNSLQHIMCTVINFWIDMINRQVEILQNMQQSNLSSEVSSVLTPGKSYRIKVQNENFLAKIFNMIRTAMAIQE